MSIMRFAVSRLEGPELPLWAFILFAVRRSAAIVARSAHDGRVPGPVPGLPLARRKWAPTRPVATARAAPD